MVWFTPANLLWLFAHLFLFIFGVVFLDADHLFNVSKGVAEGVGSGLIATGVTGEILFLYVMISDSTRARLELFTEAGLLKLFPHRSVRMKEEYEVRLKDAKEIDILGFGQSSFRQDYSGRFAEFATRATVRILLIDPTFPRTECSVADQRDVEEGNHPGQIRSDVAEFIRVTKATIGLDTSRFQVRLFRAIPSVSLFRIDNVIFWGPYFIGEQSRNTPTLLVHRGGSLFDRLKGHFEKIWSSDNYSSSIEI